MESRLHGNLPAITLTMLLQDVSLSQELFVSHQEYSLFPAQVLPATITSDAFCSSIPSRRLLLALQAATSTPRAAMR